MNQVSAAALAILAVTSGPALAHHVMDGTTPATIMQGFLSGLGHPVIGIDHFAAVVAIGCLSATHRSGPALVIGFTIAMMLGVAMRFQGVGVPASELLITFTVIGLGVILVRQGTLPTPVAFILFALVGLIHGSVFGESISGAERSPFAAYLTGLAVIQLVVALAAGMVARAAIRRSDLIMMRLIGASVAGIGLAILMQQIVPAL